MLHDDTGKYIGCLFLAGMLLSIGIGVLVGYYLFR